MRFLGIEYYGGMWRGIGKGCCRPRFEVPKDQPFIILDMSRYGQTPRTPLLNPMPSTYRASPALRPRFCESLLLSRHKARVRIWIRTPMHNPYASISEVIEHAHQLILIQSIEVKEDK